MFSRNALRSLHLSAIRYQQYLDASPSTFIHATSSRNSVVLVDFYADWCGPCRLLSPTLERLTSSSSHLEAGSGASVDLVTIDVDKHPELAAEHQVRSLPTVLAFKEGRIVAKFIGARDEKGVRDFVKDL